MNYRMIACVTSRILLAEAALMSLSLMTAAVYGESLSPFLLTMLFLALFALPFGLRVPKDTALYARDGFAVVASAWILLSVFGALPFVLSGDIPDFVDAFFETVSGFTTTGASILPAVEPLHKGILFWRSFTHWVGGMGVLVFVMAVLPMSDGHGMHLMRAEVPGPSVGKLVSRMSESAKILYGIYTALTVLEIVILLLGGMPFFDSCVHAFGSAGTGGFSNRNLSVGAYDNPFFDVVIGTFMLLFSINFNLYYYLLMRRFSEVWKSETLWTFLGIVGLSVLAIAGNITSMYGSFFTALRHAYFQVASIISTSGFSTVDFNLWPSFSRAILTVLMFIGACAGSTGGGIKVDRLIILVKASVRDMKKMLHPNAVASVRFEGKPLPERNIQGVHTFIAVYLMIFVASYLLLSLEGFDLISTFTALSACINNIGPGLEMVGPSGNFAAFSGASKLLLSFDMLVGRLEMFPMLLLFAPSMWRRRRLIRRSPF
ncbi:MAG: TrkH family potassium uptake protein [Oscillibacter sp.]|nr:TrkH family potassium uptake protein [Oscillibacter sp.]